MPATEDTIEGVKDVIVTILGIEDRRKELTPQTGLFGAMPELDSLAVLELMAALEDRFDIEIDADDVTAEHFGDVASLSNLVEALR